MMSAPYLAIAMALTVVAATPAATTVSIENFTFEPATITVPAGSAVTWVNHDDIPHLVASTDKLFKSSGLDTDDQYTMTFAKAGTFPYFCGLHPHITGTVIVTAAR